VGQCLLSVKPYRDRMTQTEGLSIGQVATRTGLSVHTLRFYEREGLLPSPVRRGPDGRRSYSEDDADWLEMCTNFRASGMPLPEIRRYATLVREGPGNETDRLAVLRQHQHRVTQQITQLTECLDLITYKVKIYEEHVAEGTAALLWSAPQAGQSAQAQ
jgi:DNA-binding transcriptional MerR regulator